MSAEIGAANTQTAYEFCHMHRRYGNGNCQADRATIINNVSFLCTVLLSVHGCAENFSPHAASAAGNGAPDLELA
ncbi:hypothetical protein KL928_005128 [Ogataea angusta]|uniref:Uncharacterized protein n=1 Tax=Pichia angusta TaxID=870730 RepID=A0AAN6DB29_PICAN|nr:uncharacterized protein KL928_005128 [Ogataea angusta]KAG7816162.1 hypothetical protein KL928_005128 [Ogataea angusta]